MKYRFENRAVIQLYKSPVNINFSPITFHMQTGFFIAQLLMDYLILVAKSFDVKAEIKWGIGWY